MTHQEVVDSSSCFPSDQSGTWCLLHLSLSLDPIYQDEEVWNCLGLSCPSEFSGTRPYIRRSSSICSQPWFQTEPLGPPGVCVSLFAVSSIVWSTGILPKGLLEPSLTWKPLLHQFSVHIWVGRTAETSGRYNMGDSVPSSNCHMRSTMGSWLVQMPGVASSLPLWMLGWGPTKCRSYPCTTSRMSRCCHFHIWGTWCTLQTVPWYVYRKLPIRVHKGCLYDHESFILVDNIIGMSGFQPWPGTLVVVVVVVVCCCWFCSYFLTRSNQLQPVVIQYKCLLAIITVTCCMGPVCALVLFFTACQFVYAGR